MNDFRQVAVILLLATLFSSEIGAAEDQSAESKVTKSKTTEIKETVLGMNVSGNKEAPNLLYIIPWKEISTEANPPEVYRLMDEIYSTVDPDVFEKEVVFYEQLTTTKGVETDDSEN